MAGKKLSAAQRAINAATGIRGAASRSRESKKIKTAMRRKSRGGPGG